MFDNLLGDSAKMQEKMLEKLKTIEVNESLDGIEIKANAAREIISINLPSSILSAEKKEQLEDQLIVLINRTLRSITDVEQQESAQLMKEMLPPGFDQLFG